MPVPENPFPSVPEPIYPFSELSPVQYFSVARKAQYFTNAKIAVDLGGCLPRQVSKNIRRAIERLVALEALLPGSITEDIIQMYLQTHAPKLFGGESDGDKLNAA